MDQNPIVPNEANNSEPLEDPGASVDGANNNDHLHVNPLENQVLRVWERKYGSGCWHPDYGEIDPPDGWEEVPSGSHALTRKIKKGKHWILLVKDRRWSKQLGVIAPSESVAAAKAYVAVAERFAKKSKGGK